MCAGCGEATGKPLVGRKGGAMFHVKCKPETPPGTVAGVLL